MSTATYIGNSISNNDDNPGDHPFYEGIPARDLTAEDYAALTPDQQAIVQASPLYVFTP